MAKPVSRVRFAIRFGGGVRDPNGLWTYFDDSIGYIEDWSGMLSEGPVGGDIIEQDWTDGALWQQGKSKTYSFDVPFTALVSTTLTEPNLWDSYSNGGIELLKTFRGPQLTLRREFIDASGNLVRQEQAIAVLVTDLATTVGLGRVIHGVAVFQNLTGYWIETPTKTATFTEDFSKGISPAVWTANAAFTASNNQCLISWNTGDSATRILMTKKYFDLTGSYVIMEAIDLSDINVGGYINVVTLADMDTGEYISFRITQNGASDVIQAYSSTKGALGTETVLSPTAHRWLRISEANGVLYWHVSSNRTIWTQLYALSASALPGLKAYLVSIGLRLQGTHTTTGVAYVANINTTTVTPPINFGYGDARSVYGTTKYSGPV